MASAPATAKRVTVAPGQRDAPCPDRLHDRLWQGLLVLRMGCWEFISSMEIVRSTYRYDVAGKPASRENFARLAESMFANAPNRQIPRTAC